MIICLKGGGHFGNTKTTAGKIKPGQIQPKERLKTRSEEHPTMKPVALCAYPIQNSSAPNGIVLDPFGGSGSTLIACEQTDRLCYTAELDEKYCDVIVKRYIEHVGSDEEVFLIRDGKKTPYKNLDIPA